jgi:hypothetical protein
MPQPACEALHWLLIKSRDEYADQSWDIESARVSIGPSLPAAV